MTTPTIEQVIKHYTIIAAAQRIKVGRPCPDTIANGIRSLRGLCRAAGIPLTAPVSRINRKSIDDALVYFVARGLSRVSAISYVSQTRSVFAVPTTATPAGVSRRSRRPRSSPTRPTTSDHPLKCSDA